MKNTVIAIPVTSVNKLSQKSSNEVEKRHKQKLNNNKMLIQGRDKVVRFSFLKLQPTQK